MCVCFIHRLKETQNFWSLLLTNLSIKQDVRIYASVGIFTSVGPFAQFAHPIICKDKLVSPLQNSSVVSLVFCMIEIFTTVMKYRSMKLISVVIDCDDGISGHSEIHNFFSVGKQ